jgi:ribosome-binding factor A
MPREFYRSQRVEEQLQRALVDLIRREVRDPRVGPLTVTAVEVSRDLAHARVYFVPFDAGHPAAAMLEALRSAAGFLHIQLRKHLKMRQVPALEFVLDESIDKAAHLSSLINAAVASDRARAATHGEDEPAPPDEPPP